MKLTKSQRMVLFAMFGGKCAYCGCDLPERGWHADHIEPLMRDWWKGTEWWQRSHGKQPVTAKYPERDTIENHFPSCRACNIDKTCLPLEDWRKSLERKPEILRNNYSAWRHAERFGLVAIIETKVVFYFEKAGGKG